MLPGDDEDVTPLFDKFFYWQHTLSTKSAPDQVQSPSQSGPPSKPSKVTKIARKIWIYPKFEKGSPEYDLALFSADMFVKYFSDDSRLSKLKTRPLENLKTTFEVLKEMCLEPFQSPELTVVALPCIDIDRKRSREAKLLNPHGTRYAIGLTFKDFCLTEDRSAVLETECICMFETQYLFPNLFAKLVELLQRRQVVNQCGCDKEETSCGPPPPNTPTESTGASRD